ncbi:hypothetical protein CAPTEDRAFT_151735 [Capitella teleta]|uniref:Protein BANP n=1 Tax=Capitella teleta TaxID=283909 RepID=R7TQF3_CAPTE|nr:hypothetical protein CAPTEDRAFT_151735 [Capitella teleta]|eukprot:ELT95787.1 hypothetical protein CAPTEDRAFT_151735 [Capitella teleta]
MSSILSSIAGNVETSTSTIGSLGNSLDGVQVVIQQISGDGSLITMNNSDQDMEPMPKRARLDEPEFDQDQSIKTILFNINKAICLRLDAIESKLAAVSAQTKVLEGKIEHVTSSLMDSCEATPVTSSSSNNIVIMPHSSSSSSNAKQSPVSPPRKSGGPVVVGLPQKKIVVRQTMNDHNSANDSTSSNESCDAVHSLGPNVTLITLNSEEDFPSGIWLGDEGNPEMRVRVPITPSDLLHIHSNCRTPEKMALSLLDYLFDRDTQATSNLSGMGKHGKKQLDPLMIYGIRCHLIQRFGITEQDWHRIKQNIDSKCRTAFRRRVRGLPLTVKAFRGKAPPTYVHVINNQPLLSPSELQEIQATEDALHGGDIHEEGMGQAMMQTSEILDGNGGQIQVLHATPEQVAQLQQTHQIQILQGDQVMQLQSAMSEGIQVSMAQGNQNTSNIQVISADTGETIHIKMDPDTPSHDDMHSLSVAEHSEVEEDDDDDE